MLYQKGKKVCTKKVCNEAANGGTKEQYHAPGLPV
jgi:hypothetical protein